MARWDSLKGPLYCERRTAEEHAADARQAHAVLLRNRPTGISETVYRRHPEVLAARASNRSSSLAELAASMSPPMAKEAFAAQLPRAHAAAGVSITRKERQRQGEGPPEGTKRPTWVGDSDPGERLKCRARRHGRRCLPRVEC